MQEFHLGIRVGHAGPSDELKMPPGGSHRPVALYIWLFGDPRGGTATIRKAAFTV